MTLSQSYLKETPKPKEPRCPQSNCTQGTALFCRTEGLKRYLWNSLCYKRRSNIPTQIIWFPEAAGSNTIRLKSTFHLSHEYSFKHLWSAYKCSQVCIAAETAWESSVNSFFDSKLRFRLNSSSSECSYLQHFRKCPQSTRKNHFKPFYQLCWTFSDLTPSFWFSAKENYFYFLKTKNLWGYQLRIFNLQLKSPWLCFCLFF